MYRYIYIRVSYRLGGGGGTKQGSLGGSGGMHPLPLPLPEKDFLHPLGLIFMKIEGQEMRRVPFKEILDVFKEQNRVIVVSGLF